MEDGEAARVAKLARFYERHPPAKPVDVEKLVRQNEWGALCAKLRSRYGEDPDETAAADGIEPWKTKQERARTPPKPLLPTTSVSVAKEGPLDKHKQGDEWKQRHCELCVDDDEGPRLVYRAKPGKRTLGVASLSGSRLTRAEAGARSTFTIVDAAGLEYTFGGAPSDVDEWMRAMEDAMAMGEVAAFTGGASPGARLDLDAPLGSVPGGQRAPSPSDSGSTATSVTSSIVTDVPGDVTKEGTLEKHKEGTWKRRHCELSMDDEEGPRLVYRQKPGKRPLGIAPLTEASLAQKRMGDRATFTLVDTAGVEYTFGSADEAAVSGWVQAMRGAMGSAAPEAQEELVDADFLELEQQAEAELQVPVVAPQPQKPATMPPPLPRRDAAQGKAPIAADFMASLVGTADSPTPSAEKQASVASDAATDVEPEAVSEGVPPSPGVPSTASGRPAPPGAGSAEVAALRAANAELSAANTELSDQIGRLESAADAAAGTQAASAEASHENERLRLELSKLRRELLARTAQQEESRARLAELSAARDKAEAAASEAQADARARQEADASADSESEAASEVSRLRGEVEAARSAEAAAKSELAAALESRPGATADTGGGTEGSAEERAAWQLEREELRSGMAEEAAEKTRLVARLAVAEQERREEVEALLQQVELWEAEALRLGEESQETEGVLATVRAEAEQLFSELGVLRKESDETATELSARVRAAEAEASRLRLQMGEAEDSSASQLAEAEESTARHLAELRSEVQRLMISEAEAQGLCEVQVARIADLEQELTTQKEAAASAQQAAEAASAAAAEGRRAVEARAAAAEATAAERLAETEALEQQVVTLSASLVSSGRKDAVLTEQLESKLAASQREKAGLVNELAALRSEAADLRSASATAASVHAAKEAKITGLTADVASLTKELEQALADRHGAAAQGIEAASAQAAAFTAQVAQLESQVQEAQEAKASAEHLSALHNTQLEASERRLAAAESRRDAAESAAIRSNEELERARGEVARMEQQLAEGNAAAAKEMEEAAALKDEAEDLRAQNTAYRNRIRAMPTAPKFDAGESAEATTRMTARRFGRHDPALALLRHGAALDGRDPGFGGTMAKASALLRLVDRG